VTGPSLTPVPPLNPARRHQVRQTKIRRTNSAPDLLHFPGSNFCVETSPLSRSCALETPHNTGDFLAMTESQYPNLFMPSIVGVRAPTICIENSTNDPSELKFLTSWAPNLPNVLSYLIGQTPPIVLEDIHASYD
jgi:hypothetical protein